MAGSVLSHGRNNVGTMKSSTHIEEFAASTSLVFRIKQSSEIDRSWPGSSAETGRPMCFCSAFETMTENTRLQSANTAMMSAQCRDVLAPRRVGRAPRGSAMITPEPKLGPI